MRARSLGALTLLVAGLLVVSPMAGTAAFATPPSVPDAPTALQFDVVTPNDATLVWTAPADDGGSAITEYDWKVVSQTTLDVVASGTTDGATTSVDVPGLAIGDTFRAAVSAVNTIGASDYAVGDNFSPEAVVPDTASSVSVTPGITTADVSWDAPVYSGGTPITEYILYALNYTTGAYTTLVVSGSQTSATLTGLDPSTEYGLYLNDSNGYFEAETDEDMFTTGDATVPGALGNFIVTRDVSSNGFTVTYTAPGFDGGSPITSYVIQATDLNAGGVDNPQSATDVSADFPSENVGDEYSITGYASNAVGFGPTATADFTLDALVPQAPQNVTLTNDGHGTLEGTWDAPAYDGGSAVTGYTAVVTDSHGTHYATDPISDPTSTDVTFTVPIASAGTYTLSVTATNGVGTGVPSADSAAVAAVAATIPDTPRVNDAEPQGYHSADVYVNWMPPGDGGAPITGFTLTLYDASQNVVRTQQLDASDDQYVFTGLQNATDYTATLTATNQMGDSLPSDPFAVTTLPSVPPAPSSQTIDNRTAGGLELTITGDAAVAHLDNAEVGDWVYGYAYSSPAALGWAQVDSNGDASWTLPTLGSGVHHLAVLDANGTIIGTAQFTVASVATTDPSGLAFTGTDSIGALTIGLLAVLLGLGMIVIRRRRRSTHAG